jgi:hypothetical protein
MGLKRRVHRCREDGGPTYQLENGLSRLRWVQLACLGRTQLPSTLGAIGMNHA